LGFTGFNIRWWRRRRLVLRIIQAGQELTQGPAIEALHRIDTQASGNRIIRLRASPEVQEPGVWGVQRPIIMLPQNLTDQLSNEEIEAVLLHELIHIRRWDNLVSQFQMALCSLFWFYPIVWIIDRRLLAEREQVCDEEVLRLGYSSNHYVSSLRKVFQFCLGQTVSGVSLASGSNLKRRIENIMSRKVQPNLTHWQRVLVAGSAGIMILGSIVTGVHSQEKKESASFPDAHRQLKTALNSPTDVAGMSSKGTGTLSGSVNDASGARIPRAIVVVSNPRTGQKEITTTSPSGEYEFKLLPAGSYLLEVEELGFKLFQRQSVIVRANVKEHQDVTMEVGEVIQTIEITGKTPRVPIIPETSSPPRRIRVGGNVQATKLIVEVKPIYPENLQQAGIQGIVLMEAIIAKDGSVRAVRAINTLVNRELVEAALDAVKRWRYEPTLLNGEPIEVVTTIKVNFRLTDE
jgi:TonB family protein